MRTLADASSSGSVTTRVARSSFSDGGRTLATRPGTTCSTIASSARSFSAGSVISVAVPTTTTLR